MFPCLEKLHPFLLKWNQVYSKSLINKFLIYTILAIRIFRRETKSTYCAVSIDLMRGGLLFNYPVEIVTYVVQNEIKNEKGTYVYFNFAKM